MCGAKLHIQYRVYQQMSDDGDGLQDDDLEKESKTYVIAFVCVGFLLERYDGTVLP